MTGRRIGGTALGEQASRHARVTRPGGTASRSARALSRVAVRAFLISAAVGISLSTATDASAGDAAFGEYLSGECVTCHRKDGSDKGIPPIVGWPADQFVAVLNSYKIKDRDNVVMQNIAGKLSQEEIEALAAYFASLKTGN